MQELPIRFSIVYDAYAAGLTWLAGNGGSADPDPGSVPGLDLGNGVELSAPDVVDSHFERLIRTNSRSSETERLSSDADSIESNPLASNGIDFTGSEANAAEADVTLPNGANMGRASDDLFQDETAGSPIGSEHQLLSNADEARCDEPKRSVASLHHAVGSLAPHLLPLLQVAEEIVSANPPPAPPKSEYRTLLSAALIAEHKQQMNKQAIGIEIPAEEADLFEKAVENKYTLMASLPVAMTLALSLWYVRRSRRAVLNQEEKSS